MCGDANTPAQLSCLGGIFGNTIHAALLFILPVTVILIIISGYKFVTSQGDSKQIEGARKTLTFALVGMAIVAFSYFMLGVIAQITGVTCITEQLKHLDTVFSFNNPCK